MRSRPTVSDATRRWLQLQQDLGGDELILDVSTDLRAAAAPNSTASPARAPERPGLISASIPRAASIGAPSPGARVPASGPEAGSTILAIGGWRKDAPPIPEPGMTVISKTAALPDGPAPWQSLDEIAAVVRTCPKCALCRTRTHAVPGEGNPRAGLMIIGEGPGESEDLSGRPFVGRAGELLDKMLAAIDIPRSDAYIANVVKCRPPKNRVPLPDEREACMPYLRRQIALIQPKVLLAVGGTAAEALLGVKASLGQLRLKVHRWNGIPLIVTYHPAALLRNPNWKRPAWDDVRIARQLLDRDA